MNKWLDEEIDILVNEYANVSIDDIIKLIPNHSRQSICRKASYLGLTNFTKNQSKSQKIYTYNENFFDVPNVQNCYWAGFLAADGYLGKDGNVKIALATQDSIIVDNFKQQVNYNGPIKYVTYYNHDYVMVSIWGAHRWHSYLVKNWNIPLEQKTYRLGPPNLKNVALRYAYIVGLIDGDGSIYYTGTNKSTICLGFCGTLPIVTWMADVWSKIIGKDIAIKLNGNSLLNYQIRIFSSNAIKVCRELMITNIYWKLERKWEKIDSLA